MTSKIANSGVPTPEQQGEHRTPPGIELNRRTVAPAKLQQQVEWTGRALRDVYPELMLHVDGRPLLVIFDTTGTAQNGSYPGLRDVLNTSGWTVKWMSAFLNSPSRRFQSHTGYWSWTDGSAIPVRSMIADGSVEAVTVKPAFFRTPGGAGSYTSPGGWLAPESQPQHHRTADRTRHPATPCATQGHWRWAQRSTRAERVPEAGLLRRHLYPRP